MKSSTSKKLAQVTVMILTISVLLPVFAFAAPGFRTADTFYRDNYVTGYVYSDEPVNAQVYMYAPDGTSAGVAKTTYESVSNGVYTYRFEGASTVARQTYLRLHEVTTSTYHDVYDSSSNRRRGGGGGGGGYTGGVSGSILTVPSDGSIDANTLMNLLTNYDTVELKLTGDVALIPAKALVDFVGNTSKMLKIYNDKGTYNLPLSVLNLTALQDQLSTTVDDLKIKVTIAAASAADISGISSTALGLGATVIANAVDFGLVGIDNDGDTAEVDLGNNYVSRSIPLTKTASAANATGVVYDPAAKQLNFVPSLISSTGENGEVLIKRNSNSVYAAIERNKEFADANGHWAEGYIDLLGNKLVIDGMTDTTFEPERNVTRAEFAALVVRALGIDQRTASSRFSDVSSSDWYGSDVSSAVYAEIIDGYEDNTFRPNDAIKREELAAMVIRALEYAGVEADGSSAALTKFTDSDDIVWAQEELAAAVSSGIVDGMTDTTIGPRLQATRAQSAAMLNRLLLKANFINN
ncbi:S-layer homology domain-containing protein [Paenibacillus xerothermodurans]|uniref:S-layer homology domain-containing protein n=1 Tax=Paenibacillus xerothermodurans TaxID=1977292 RepID=A0A2W1N9G1_PAEXE|nr:S-layer homology domain-containing protein [Paenibacillus xerothermodurans]PZE21279.1 S-layer homology domain-containing protein [Paenibacillus xerothermodurans]